MNAHNEFGGDWTEKKLNVLKKYLDAYTTALKNQSFKLCYIDAFAGTGYRKETRTKEHDDEQALIKSSTIEHDDEQALSKGSAIIALDIKNPPFNEYIFIEKDLKSFNELKVTIYKHINENKKDVKERIKPKFINDDANIAISEICNIDWYKERKRAVIFLDPFGMSVDWETIKKIAGTRAIDMLVLVPLGIGINRLLKKDGNIENGYKKKLNRFLGTKAWKKEFYRTEKTIFDFKNKIKETNPDEISNFIVKRLKTCFPKDGVIEKPLKLRNSKNSILYLLCFAAGNPKAAKLAKKIAQNIFEKEL